MSFAKKVKCILKYYQPAWQWLFFLPGGSDVGGVGGSESSSGAVPEAVWRILGGHSATEEGSRRAAEGAPCLCLLLSDSFLCEVFVDWQT